MKRYGRYTVVGWSWRVLLGVTLTPFLLLLLLLVLVYLPPVQKFAVDKAAEILSSEMKMDVSVERFSLQFPLDVAVGGVLAVQDGDTVLDAGELTISLEALPLLNLEAEVGGIHLHDTKLNTKDLIEAAVIKGSVAELSLDNLHLPLLSFVTNSEEESGDSVASHSMDSAKELAVVNKVLLHDADLMILLADTVSEDTSSSGNVPLKVRIDDIDIQRVKAVVMLAPQADSTFVMADVGIANANAFLDLGAEVYQVDKLSLAETRVGYDLMKAPRLLDQLDPNHLLFEDVSLAIDSFVYKGTQEMELMVSSFTANEQTGLGIADANGKVVMDSLRLALPKFKVKTGDSNLVFAYRMDMNAFDAVNPGEFSFLGEGRIGKDDLIYFTRMGGEGTRDVTAVMAQRLPSLPSVLQVKADGNLESLCVDTLYFEVPDLFTVEGDAQLFDLTSDLSLQACVKAFDTHGALVDVDGSFAMGTETYAAQVLIDSLVVNHYVALSDTALFTGDVAVQGTGLDFFMPSTKLQATANLRNSRFGQVNLDNIMAEATMEGSLVQCEVSGDNDQIHARMLLDTELKKHLVSGKLDLDVPFVDVQAMGYSEERLQASTSGAVSFSYDWKDFFKVNSHIDALSLIIKKDSVYTDSFDLYAEARKDTTVAALRTGDCYLSFFTPCNLSQLLPQLEVFEKAAVQQFKDHDVNLNVLKNYLPEVSLYAEAGRENPFSDILDVYGIHFRELVADVDITPEQGVMGKAHLYAFDKDGVMVDTAFIDIAQDTTQLDYLIGIQCHEQPQLPAFRASLEGFLMADKADAHLTYFDRYNRKGIDLGVKAAATDSCVNYSLYPQKPVLAFREFGLNDDNYIVTRPNRPVQADVRLKSLSDSCYVAVYADENEQLMQIANVVVNDLNIKELMTIVPVPDMPSMGGILNLDAYYIDQEENFLLEGTLDANRFVYEGATVGDFDSWFSYAPRGETVHAIDANLAFNGSEFLALDGIYDAEGEGRLDANLRLQDMPVSMLNPFIPDQLVGFRGTLSSDMTVAGPMDALLFNGALMPKDMHLLSDPYSLDFTLANDTIPFVDSRVTFDDFKFYGADDNPLALNGSVDFSDFEELFMSLSLRGSNFKLIEAQRSKNKVLFGDMYGDFFARVIGSTSDLTVRGLVRVLPTTRITYIMTETPLYQGDRLEDIVTFVDFNAPPPPREEILKKKFMGIDMNMMLSIEDGAMFSCEFSADKQSYINVQGGGSVTMLYTPEGVLNLQGKYTINEGEMKYALPIIPLKTFTIHNGSYIEFTGNPVNPVLNVAATERVRAAVGQSDGSSRSVAFDVGLKITNSLDNMGLAFTIEAPEDQSVQNELANCSAEEKNKLAVAMLATGMYLSGTNSKGFTAGNALNNFLQNEINNIAGRALSTMVDINVGMEQTTRDDGTSRTDYSFKFSRRFFSDRLNVVIGGKVSADGNTEENESGAYIDDVSLEWRLDNGGTQYIRLFHEKDYSNLIEGELDKNGAGVLLRKKVDKLSDLFLWRRKEESPKP